VALGQEYLRRAWRRILDLERNHGAGKPQLCTVEKQLHAQRLKPLHGNQPHLPADMVAVTQQVDLSFVVGSVAFQSLDAFFDGAPKARTDFKAFLRSAAGHHGGLLGRGMLPAEIILQNGLMFSALMPILPTANCARQITFECVCAAVCLKKRHSGRSICPLCRLRYAL
jgi:hypothetical protein